MSQTTSSKRGPKTPEGKRRSSMNALKHGLTAKTPQALAIIAEECQTSLQEITDRMRAHYRPRDPVDEQLVDRIARCAWRLAMAAAMEGRLLERNPTLGRPGPSYERVMRFERLVDIHMHRAIQALARKREAENKCNASNENYPRSF